MKALLFSHYGKPDVLRIMDLARPVPGPGEVLVTVSAAAVNPSDVKNVAGLFSAVLPHIPGRDFAGTVVSEGEWYGREVWGIGPGSASSGTEGRRNISACRFNGFPAR